jgi:drug/metabolite transporter (DMT)-like permease
MSLKTAIVLTIMVLAGAFGDVLVSKGMKQVGEINSAQPGVLLRAGLRAAHNPFVVGGVLGLAVYFFSFSIVLSWEDVSLVVPISALSFLITTFVAQRSLGEHVTPQRWCGTILIVLGVILVARSHDSASRAQLPSFQRESAKEAKDAKRMGHEGTQDRTEGRPACEQESTDATD